MCRTKTSSKQPNKQKKTSKRFKKKKTWGFVWSKYKYHFLLDRQDSSHKSPSMESSSIHRPSTSRVFWPSTSRVFSKCFHFKNVRSIFESSGGQFSQRWENSKEQDGHFFSNEWISNSECGFCSVNDKYPMLQPFQCPISRVQTMILPSKHQQWPPWSCCTKILKCCFICQSDSAQEYTFIQTHTVAIIFQIGNKIKAYVTKKMGHTKNHFKHVVNKMQGHTDTM